MLYGCAGTIAYFVISSAVYRYFRILPMMLPRCPVCRDANRHYWSIVRDWPTEVIKCANCNTEITLHVDHEATRPARENPVHYYALQWPYSLSFRWRRIVSRPEPVEQ
jgi:hypothetical protein